MQTPYRVRLAGFERGSVRRQGCGPQSLLVARLPRGPCGRDRLPLPRGDPRSPPMPHFAPARVVLPIYVLCGSILCQVFENDARRGLRRVVTHGVLVGARRVLHEVSGLPAQLHGARQCAARKGRQECVAPHFCGLTALVTPAQNTVGRVCACVCVLYSGL